VGGVFLESGVAIDSSATMIQDVAIAFKAKNFSNAIALQLPCVIATNRAKMC
jgi:hypothetical protein